MLARHFVIVGAQRSGTTGLYRLLEQHPDICMARPVRPEPKFFLQPDAVQSGYDSYRRRFFGHHRQESLLGEKSTSYIERADAIPRLRAVLPHARLIFVLRDPVRRAWSNWRFSRAHGLETLGFDEALAREAERLQHFDSSRNGTSVNPFAYQARGDYARYLEAWTQVFPRQQITLVLSERLFSDHAEARRVLRQLDVDPEVPLDHVGPVNANGDHGPELPPRTAARLRQHFAAGIDELARQWQVDVSPWQ